MCWVAVLSDVLCNVSGVINCGMLRSVEMGCVVSVLCYVICVLVCCDGSCCAV